MSKKKKLITTLFSIIMSAMLCVLVYADDNPATVVDDSAVIINATDGASGVKATIKSTPYPTDIQLVEQGGRIFIHKTYTVPANYNIQNLVEKPFVQADVHYEYSEIIQRAHSPASDKKIVSERRIVENESNKKSDILALLGISIPYSDVDGYSGELFLVEDSFSVEESSHSNYTYSVNDVREYPGLDRNDPSYVPATIEKSGLTLTLQDINWRTTDSIGMGYSDVSTQYTAVAYYSTLANGTKATGYTATATYSGEVVKELVGSDTYTIVYEGEQIVVPFNFLPFILAGIGIVICIIAGTLIWNLHKNVIISTMQDGIPEEYAKLRINPHKAKLDLRNLDTEIQIVITRALQKKLMDYDSTIFVYGRYFNHHIFTDKSLTLYVPLNRPQEIAVEDNNRNCSFALSEDAENKGGTDNEDSMEK